MVLFSYQLVQGRRLPKLCCLRSLQLRVAKILSLLPLLKVKNMERLRRYHTIEFSGLEQLQMQQKIL